MKKNILAIILIGIGALLLLGNIGLLDEEGFLFIISFGFFAGYFLSGRERGRRLVGLLIPACIILAVGAFSVLETNMELFELEGSIFFGFLGTAFLAVYLIHTLWLRDYSRGERIWPLITALCIYAFGAAVFAIEYMGWGIIGTLFEYLLPALLILAGLAVLVTNIFKGKKQ